MDNETGSTEITELDFELRTLYAFESSRLKKKWKQAIYNIFGDTIPYRIDWKGGTTISRILSHVVDTDLVLQFPNQKAVQFGSVKALDDVFILVFSKHQMDKRFSPQVHQVYFVECERLTFFSPLDCFLLETGEVLDNTYVNEYLDIFKNQQYVPDQDFERIVLGKGVVALMHYRSESNLRPGYSAYNELIKNREGLSLDQTIQILTDALRTEW